MRGKANPTIWLLCVLLAAWPAQAKYSGGTGEPNDPYQIATGADLIALGETPDDYDKHFILTADIDLDPNLPGGRVFDRAVIAPDTDDARNFQGATFTGRFNGNNHTIKNLRINKETAEYLGLFGWIDSSGHVSNVILSNVSITGSSCIGGLAGCNRGTIINCSTTGSIISKNGGRSIGGLAGVNGGGISDCQANTSLGGGPGSQSFGGLVGSMSFAFIQNSRASGSVSTAQQSNDLGGLIGYLYNAEVRDSYAIGDVICGDDSGGVGGLIGNIWDSGSISQCYSMGSVTVGGKSRSVGGLIGRIGRTRISDCYAVGDVSGYIQVGGLIGYLGLGSRVENCYAVGRVRSNITTAFIGGLFGETAREYVWIEQCFWDVETSGLATSAGGTGLTTSQMQDIETYRKAGWDMAGDRADGTADIWKMPEGRGYPELAIFAQDYVPHILAGNGTPESPYRIGTPEDLAAICRYDTSACYVLTSDIDLSGITWANAPVPAFGGVLDGGGHRIVNLTLHAGAEDSGIGLFGSISGRIQGIGLENVSITAGDGSSHIGGLAGSNWGHIACCYVTGGIAVAEKCWDVGGLTGFNEGDITYCYSACSISNGKNSKLIGGLVGNNYYKITQCFASGSILSEGNSTDVGGLIGYNAQRDYLIKSCFWDIEKSGLSQSDGGTGLTTAQMQDPSVFMDAGWDFARESDGPSDIWAQPVGGGYPILWWELPDAHWPPLPSFSGGTGEPNDPYMISIPDQLNGIGYNPRLVNSHYRLANDIDLTGVGSFTIGNEIFPFSGTFDGNSCTISNFSHASTGTNYVGLFGYVDGAYAEVKDIRLVNPNIVATAETTPTYLHRYNVGSLVGRLETGTVTRCSVEGGSVSGFGYYNVGGLVGVSYGTITDCVAVCVVSGSESVGGLAGGQWSGHITNCHANCVVTGTKSVGGLIGSGSGIITNCSSSGNVSGHDRMGGLSGGSSGEIAFCYSASEVLSDGSSAGGLVGDNTGTITDSYATGGTSGNSIVAGLVGSNGYINRRDVYWEYPGYVSNCYSTGRVSGTASAGGLVGQNVVGSIISSFWNAQSSGQATSAAGSGKTTAEMQMASTFLDAGWDFVGEAANGMQDIWWIDEGRDYPRLWWQAR